MYDKIDPSQPVHVRVVQNGNYIWQDDLTKEIYQVDGYPIDDCEFDLEKLTYEYCNPPLITGSTTYDFISSSAYAGDETLVREDNNIFHFDAFAGPKKTVWPEMNIPQYYYAYWYDWWATYWNYYNGAYYAPTVIGWSDSYTNVDSLHMFSYYGVRDSVSAVQCLYSSFENIVGCSPVIDDYLYPCYLSPYVSVYFEPNTQFPTGWTNYGGYNGEPILKESFTGYRIVGATFDGFNLVLRPYSFSNCGIVSYFSGSMEYEGYEPLPYDSVCIPPDYSLWPWKNTQEVSSYTPIWHTYPVYDDYYYGLYWWWGSGFFPYYPSGQFGFSLKKGGVRFTKLTPEIQNYDGGYSVYIYRNVIIYGDNPRTQNLITNGVFSGRRINWYTRATVVDVYVSFKKQQFPDIGSIPNIDQVKRLAVNAVNYRQLEYRDYSYRAPQFRAYVPLTPEEARSYVYPYMEDYLGYIVDDDPYWFDYFGYAVFEWSSFNYYTYGQAVTTFYAYDPYYQYLYQPEYMEIGTFEPGILSSGLSRFSYSNKNQWLYSRGNYQYYYDPINFQRIEFNGSIPFVSNDNIISNLNISLGDSNYYYYSYTSSKMRLNAKAGFKYDFEYTEGPTYSLFINTLGNVSTREYYGSQRMQDRFATPGFGDGWFRIAVSADSYPGGFPYRSNSINVVDPNGNYLKIANLNAEYVSDSSTPYSDRELIPPYYGNYTIDEYDSLERVHYWWFYSSEQSLSPFGNGILSSKKTNAYQLKPFGTYYQGYPNNEKFCGDGIYLVLNEQYINQGNLNSGFYGLSGYPQTIEYPIGAFYISTQNGDFQIYDVPIYYVPNLDLSRPYSGIMNSSFSCYQDYYVDYYSDLDGKTEIYLTGDYDQDMVNKLIILGPNGQNLTYGVDYEINYQEDFNKGNFRIKFLNALGYLYDNEPTGNPPHLSDGEYKIFIPRYKQMFMSCNSLIENYSSLKQQFLAESYYYYSLYNSEFYYISNSIYSNIYNEYYQGLGFQFYSYDTSFYLSQRHTLSNYYLISLSPIVFVVTDCIFQGDYNGTNAAFKCDMIFQEYLEPYELPVNPPGFNNLLNGSLFAEGGYNY